MTKFNMPAATTRLHAAQTKLREIESATYFRESGDPLPEDALPVAQRVTVDLATALAEIDRLTVRNAELVATVRDLALSPKSDDTRASGRTTRLILRGLIAMSEGHDVLIVAATSAHAQSLVHRMAGMAVDLHIPFTNVRGVGRNEPRTGFRGVTLIDHHAIEQMEEAP